MDKTKVLEKAIDAARVAHEANREFCRINNQNIPAPWESIPAERQEGIINGVLHYLQNPDLEAVDMHDNWSKEMFAKGWTYGEEKDEVKKTHPCLVPYELLSYADKVKDDLFMSVIDVLIDYKEAASLSPDGKYRYFHHGELMTTNPKTKGTHRQNCLCFQGCVNFNPEDREKNCPVANEIYETCKKRGVVTPVYECSYYEGTKEGN